MGLYGRVEAGVLSNAAEGNVAVEVFAFTGNVKVVSAHEINLTTGDEAAMWFLQVDSFDDLDDVTVV
jgi:hypothetical protein